MQWRMTPNIQTSVEVKVKHWRALQAENALQAAPDLEFRREALLLPWTRAGHLPSAACSANHQFAS